VTKARPTALEQLVARVEGLGHRLIIGPDRCLMIIDAKTWAVVMRADDIAEIARWVAGRGRSGKVIPFPKTLEPPDLPPRLGAETRADIASGKWRLPEERTAQLRAELAEVLAKLREASGETEPSHEVERRGYCIYFASSCNAARRLEALQFLEFHSGLWARPGTESWRDVR